jgi:phenylpropionate dioxygenase-like ring-hydroxylating dioxygenase large terminal subunit
MNVQNPDGLGSGEARTPGQSTRDVIMRDPIAPPAAILKSSPKYLGSEDLPYTRYTSRDFYDQEMDKMWNKVWQWACREEHIPNPGDQYVYEVGTYSILIARTEAGEVKAYFNSCLHRGTQLRPTDFEGYGKDFRCPYHGWTWSLEGELVDQPCDWDFPHAKPENFSLPEVQVGLWGGFVFINMDENCEPLEDYLGPLTEHFADFFPLERKYIEVHLRRTLPVNWKAAAEAFIEAYHVRETHAFQTEIGCAATNAEYDIFSDNVTRFIHTIGYNDVHWPATETAEQIATAMGDRIIAAEAARAHQLEKYNFDASDRSECEMMDSIEYFLFPNMFLFPGITLPMIYRFRPNNDDVDSCWFDLMFLRPLNEGETHPEPPECVHLDVSQTYATVPNMDPGLAIVYEQDTSNMEAQQKGFKASKKRGETLANFQESRTRQLHVTLDKYLNAE